MVGVRRKDATKEEKKMEQKIIEEDARKNDRTDGTEPLPQSRRGLQGLPPDNLDKEFNFLSCGDASKGRDRAVPFTDGYVLMGKCVAEKQCLQLLMTTL